MRAGFSGLLHFFLRIFLLAAVMVLAACASTTGNAKTPPPRWVTHTEEVYPNSEWLCIVDREKDRKSAEAAAMTGLAQVFRVDLNSVTTANRQFAQALGNVKGKNVSVSSESREFAQDLVSESNVSGLIGLRTEVWAAPDGTVYANARMNRQECAARYSAMIREYEKIIRQMKTETAQNPATFESVERLNFAVTVAQAADNFYMLLTVLDPSTVSSRPEYGNAEAVKSLALEAARSIIVTVDVEGDVGGRIAGAFSGYFTSRGFRTNTTGANPYRLSAAFELMDVDTGAQNKFVRYVLKCSVKNKNGVEVFSHSENNREGHLTQAEARQRAIRAAETSIGSTGFSVQFDAYLASLLQ